MISNISQTISMPLSQAHGATVPSASAAKSQIIAEPTSQGTILDMAAGRDQQAAAEATLATAVDHLNAKIQNLNRNVEFSLDKDSGNVVVRVVDAQTRELIRQIPNEDVLALAHHIKQYELDHPVGLLTAEA
jgi:flagellar protein FlaG